MNYRKLIVLALVWALAILPGTEAWGHPAKVIVIQPEQAVCPSRALVVGTVVIQGGRCFTPLLLRTVQGTFLAFAPTSVFIPPGQILRLDTPLGAHVRAQIFSLLLLSSNVVFIPVNTFRLVIVRIEDGGSKLIISIPGNAIPVVILPPTSQQSTAALPDDVRILTPGPEVTADEAAFSGKWMGELKGRLRGIVEGTLPHTLVVEEMRRDDPERPTTAIVVFAWGTAPQWGISSGWYRLRATFDRGVLRVALPSGAQVAYWMSADGALTGTYERADIGILQATMRRAEEQRL